MQIRHGSMYYSSNRVKVLNVMAESERHHMRACFGPSDQLVLVLPNKPSSGQPATVEIHDAQMLEVQNEFECRSLFAGPLVGLDAPNYKLFYQCKKWMTGTQNIVKEEKRLFELIGNFLEHHIKQNGLKMSNSLKMSLLSLPKDTGSLWDCGTTWRAQELTVVFILDDWFDSSDFEENDASQRFDEILNASPPATDVSCCVSFWMQTLTAG
ncbi:protein transport protein Sec16B-like [Mercenaria mercenaria]|uniref:protein transport protein Sec16B-like n=1 Tax=Mercenaria mercenaria TaxID=6596 RepID=UPI00234E3D6B|nr:protein transport protein Sec16B-like [Mercenaria mercenaria]